MSKRILVTALSAVLLSLTPGCYTQLAVNFGNRTPAKVWVKSTKTGNETEIPAGRFRKLPHSVGDLVVTTSSQEKLRFSNVSPMHVDPDYVSRRASIFGPGFITLTVTLETNMQLYVVMPGKKTVDPTVAQPNGYPKIGQKMSE